MRIAFYAPLKSPDHPVPSGDRLMARLLMAALRQGEDRVELASQLRSYLGDAQDWQGLAKLQAAADVERDRLRALWQRDGPPDLWLCYHPYYKAPDLIGPALCKEFSRPYVTVEASYSARRNHGIWAGMQAQVHAAVSAASVNICLTARDHDGLKEGVPRARLARLAPFIDATALLKRAPEPQPTRLICVAMMRAGDKADSYAHLAAALDRLQDLPWHLTIVGDGPARAQIEARFAAFAPERLSWVGQQDEATIAGLLAQSAIYVWPGCGEAFGLAYLEAQAAGVPVLAWRTAGVPEVVADGVSGVLTPEGDDGAYADALASLLQDAPRRAALAQGARARVAQHHTLQVAAAALKQTLGDITGGRT
ncbi:glycosyltransferase [Pseudooceanicola sediminis]|uniref:Glycosyltransferase n=1 Tax=Pseudooceanicola sediminis TaxID=2211117 RepID=A0A399IXK4_9RHOB|nr:glycosyltransferase family 4 protein [Pseudooceanicola sediminis]RII37908.1 glycosyltransferase [Pseudooceanicola sediminis]|tara:strand:+ start:6447 stop:7544 length:1098 start_codon:yes stop_codon:yes gene_type:complete